jgi:hypothetical protein
MLEKEISRRTLLKVIAAGCGVVVASSLPRKWVKPVIDAGLLPVHAQTTSGGTIIGRVMGCAGGLPDPVPVEGATVSVDTPTPMTATSDGLGMFIISGVPEGTYTLSTSVGWDISGVGVTEGEITNAGDIGPGGC